METDPTYPVNLITAYLSGEATGDDLVFLEAWLKAGPENRKMFEDYRRVWMNLEQMAMENSADIDLEWNALQSRLSEVEPGMEENIAVERELTVDLSEIKPLRPNRFTPFVPARMLKIAAILLVILIPSFFIFRNLSHPVQEQLQASLTVREGKLPDGTSVTLNKGAVLEYPSRFNGKKRNVTLSGEAYFEVQHDDTKPFIIFINKVRVEVLGTSFYVNTNTSGNTVEVILNSGSVVVYFDNQIEKKLMLTPGEKAELNPGTEKMEKEINPDPNYRAWMTERFVYNNTALSTIVADLNKVYNANIRIVTPALAGCLVTATFDHQTVGSILHVLQATLDMKITARGSTTELSGNKCN